MPKATKKKSSHVSAIFGGGSGFGIMGLSAKMFQNTKASCLVAICKRSQNSGCGGGGLPELPKMWHLR